MHAEKVSIIVYFGHVRHLPLYFSPGQLHFVGA